LSWIYRYSSYLLGADRRPAYFEAGSADTGDTGAHGDTGGPDDEIFRYVGYRAYEPGGGAVKFNCV
jgi:hypothetical protein